MPGTHAISRSKHLPFCVSVLRTISLASIGLLVLVIPKSYAKVVTVDPVKSEIVVVTDAPIETRFAAGELQKHLKLITSMEIPIVEQGKWINWSKAG